MTLKKSFLGINIILLLIPLISSLYMYNEGKRRKSDFIDYNKSIRGLIKTYDNEKPEELKKHLQANTGFIVYNDDNNLIYSTDITITSNNPFAILENNNYFSSIYRHKEQYIIVFTLKNNIRFSGNKPRYNFIHPLIPSIISILLVTIISIVILRVLRKNIFSLTNASTQISSGDLEYEILDTSVEELMPLKDSLENLKSELSSSRDKRARFIMGISHDLKTPLALIDGYVEALSDKLYENEEEKDRYLDIIKDKSQELEDILSDLIDLSRLDTGEWKANLKVNNLGIELDKIASNFKMDSKLLGKNFNYKRTCELSAASDLRLLKRVLDNLFSNAVKAIKSDGIIKMLVYSKENNTIIEIMDNGVGINTDDLGMIFEPFYKGSKSRTDKGHGLGLATVKTIILNHNWDITVESPSNLGSGTSFKIII